MLCGPAWAVPAACGTETVATAASQLLGCTCAAAAHGITVGYVVGCVFESRACGMVWSSQPPTSASFCTCPSVLQTAHDVHLPNSWVCTMHAKWYNGIAHFSSMHLRRCIVLCRRWRQRSPRWSSMPALHQTSARSPGAAHVSMQHAPVPTCV
jgi:hypothetical protein